jgi:hypothetical protein
MIPKVISFYTPNTPYQQEVDSLKNSCERFSIPFEIEPVESMGSWEENVALKPKFIAEKRASMSGPLLWIDADAAFLKEPDFTLFKGVDFSVRFMAIFQDRPEHAINAATIFIADTNEARALCNSWIDCALALTFCNDKKAPPFVDQIALYEVLLENKHAKVLPMPASYCKIYDIDQFFVSEEDVVIEQRQASRIHR